MATVYDDAGYGLRLDDRVAAAVRRELAHAGDVLVFLPGAGEIRRSARALATIAAQAGCDVVTLHGDQPWTSATLHYSAALGNFGSGWSIRAS